VSKFEAITCSISCRPFVVMPEISVIITTHTRPLSLVRAVESARSASRRDVEVVVVDDASTDETASVCRSLNGINYVRAERNQGVAGARNLGILSSSGEFLTFLDDDDVRLPGSLDTQVATLLASPDAGMIYGQALVAGQDGTSAGDFYPVRCPQGELFWELLAQNFIPCGAAVFRRSCLYRVGLLDDAASGVDDWDLWIRIAEAYRVLALERPVVIWRESTPTSGQGSSNAVRMVKQCTRRFRERWMSLPLTVQASAAQRGESYRRFSDTMTRHLLREAVRSLAAGQLLLSQKNILAALYLYPAALARLMLHPHGFRLLLKRAVEEWQALKSGARRLPQTGGESRT
jgi:cellulose synthase/poly-beta-1,6-N-acetylglucosamine synthase-like glycosyltransferase